MTTATAMAKEQDVKYGVEIICGLYIRPWRADRTSRSFHYEESSGRDDTGSTSVPLNSPGAISRGCDGSNEYFREPLHFQNGTSLRNRTVSPSTVRAGTRAALSLVDQGIPFTDDQGFAPNSESTGSPGLRDETELQDERTSSTPSPDELFSYPSTANAREITASPSSCCSSNLREPPTRTSYGMNIIISPSRRVPPHHNRFQTFTDETRDSGRPEGLSEPTRPKLRRTARVSDLYLAAIKCPRM